MADWFAMSDLPPVRAVVRVWWYAFGTPECFEVARTWRQSKRAFEWLRYDPETQEVHPIPPKGRDKHHWAPEPTCWQPLDASVWRWPGDVPKPLMVHQVPRMAGTDYLSREVDAAELEEAGREAERDRHDAQRSERHAAKPEPGSRWWLDITNMRYEPRGEVTRKMAEGRVLRALAWCDAWEGISTRRDQQYSQTAMVAAEASRLAEIEQSDRQNGRVNMTPKFQPLPRDHDDFPTAMSWFAAINPPELWRDSRTPWTLSRPQRIMLKRTLTIPLTWENIAFEFNISNIRVRQLYAKGIDACWRVANGGEAIPGKRITDQIVALQERNREYRRRA